MEEENQVQESGAVEETTTAEPETVESLKEKLQAKEAELEKSKDEANIGKKVAEGFERLNQRLAPEEKKEEKKIKTIDEVMEEIDFDKEIFEKPKETIKKVVDTLNTQHEYKMSKLVEETVKDRQAGIAAQVKALVKDPENGWLIEKYGGEVQQILDAADPALLRNPNVVNQALDIVKARHFSEAIQRGVDAELRRRELGKTHTEGGGNNRPAPQIKVEVIQEDIDNERRTGIPRTVHAQRRSAKAKGGK